MKRYQSLMYIVVVVAVVVKKVFDQYEFKKVC